MGHTEIKNDFTCQLALQHLASAEGFPVAVAVTKTTFAIEGGKLHIAEEQLPVFPAGKPRAKAGESSYIYEPECSYTKPNTDIVLVAEATAAQPATCLEVQFSVGAYRKRAVVFGDRYWERSLGGPRLTDPEPFNSMSLSYEQAFGGWDRTHQDSNRHSFDARNPVGTGFQRQFGRGEDRLLAPNIEDPKHLIAEMSDRPKPVGFGFTNADWQPRASLAGTYDAPWKQNRMPLLPVDFDPSFFNSASEGLVARGYLSGDELVTLVNCAREPVLNFFLPAIQAPLCRFRIRGRTDQDLSGPLDTVVVNAMERVVTLTWRCHVLLPRGPESLLELHVRSGS